MSGNSIVADTSLLVNFFNGLDLARDVIEGQQIWVSCITEIELLSFNQLSEDETKLIRSFLNHCHIEELHHPIRQKAIEIRKTKHLKVPDSIIAATAIHLNIPLVTMDSDFQKVDSLDSIILQA